ncbi:hypothetical protein M2909_05585 [Vagococcus lutrae]|uniref:hypothetical protein n=1 Tax=Vagococcus lutrae TaxID=81947 RepID=UPI00200DF104|nr:hypothetical protein [Vagococcus lutrae]UQF22628.1 hypothetical protein M2909_05585 [Vagococcus lutrae]UQF63453.1 hypothetical protein M2908_06130 [Vagococcus lutrae]
MKKYGNFCLVDKSHLLLDVIIVSIFFLGFAYPTYAAIVKETTVTVGFRKEPTMAKPPEEKPIPSQTIDEGRGAAVVQYVDVIPSRIKKHGRLPQTNEQALPIQCVGWTLVGLTGLMMLIGAERGEER